MTDFFVQTLEFGWDVFLKASLVNFCVEAVLRIMLQIVVSKVSNSW